MSIRINGGVEVPFIYRDNKPVQYVYIGSNLYYHKGNLTPGLIDRRLTSYIINDTQNIIGDYAFHGCAHLKTINISTNCKATLFGANAFSSCVNLTSITVPNAVTKIGSGCFQYDLNLTSVVIDSTRSRLNTIEADAFRGCVNLTNLQLPPTIKAVGKTAFCSCLNLTAVSLTNETEVIDSTAFYGCIALSSIDMSFNKVSNLDCLESLVKIEYLSVGDNITPPQVYNFIQNNKQKVTGLTTLLFNSGNVTAPTYIINGRTSNTASILKNILETQVSIVSISLPTSLTHIPASFCYRDTTKPKVQYVSISSDSTITHIDDLAFSYTYIKSITIPDTVQMIGSKAFFNCLNLNNVNISKTSQIKSIHDLAFGFSAISSIYIPSTIEYISPYAFNNAGRPGLKIECGFKSSSDLPVMATFPWTQDAKGFTFVFQS